MLDFGFYNMDCMDGMKQFPDKYFDLAIVDPPYGINVKTNMGRRKNAKNNNNPIANWDSAPPNKSYFDELFRNCFVFQNIRLFGAEIILNYRQQNRLLFGTSRICQSVFRFQCANTLGLILILPQKHSANLYEMKAEYIQHRNPYSYMNGFCKTMQNREIRF